MKRTLKAIGTIGTMLILLVGAYWLGTTQAETITEIKVVEKIVEVVPENYINVKDIVDWNTDGEEISIMTCDGYEWYAYKSSDEYIDNYVDMRQVTNFKATENSLWLYLASGDCYYWER